MKYVEQEKPVTTDHPVLGKIEFKVETGNVQSVEEMVKDAGGEENLVAFYNGQRDTNAKNTARAYARNFEVPKDVTLTDEIKEKYKADIATKGQTLARDYSPATDSERGPSKAKKAAAFDQLKALVDSGTDFSREQLFELINSAK